MTRPRRTGVLGGTFDPIHLGHLAVAGQARLSLDLDEVLLIPSLSPPHRASGPAASPFHRFAMVALAAAADPCLLASDVELQRSGPSYTADTLRRLHALGYRPEDLFFLTGADAFADIATWREYPGVLSLAHFVVSSRPGLAAPALPARLPALAPRMCQLDPSGPPPAIGAEPCVFLLDCVTPPVSSTDIRALARDGRRLAGLVPPDVDTYIFRHRLYSAPGAPAADGEARGRQLA